MSTSKLETSLDIDENVCGRFGKLPVNLLPQTEPKVRKDFQSSFFVSFLFLINMPFRSTYASTK